MGDDTDIESLAAASDHVARQQLISAGKKAPQQLLG